MDPTTVGLLGGTLTENTNEYYWFSPSTIAVRHGAIHRFPVLRLRLHLLILLCTAEHHIFVHSVTVHYLLAVAKG